ncbi:MAG TPA: PA0069 family radical SAM protein [Tepidisphaeraceae bacterium]|jgi:DNA repair photolyase
MSLPLKTLHGRGAADNPPNRFEPIALEPDPEYGDPDPARPQTQYLRDTSRSIICHNDSPDVGFEYSINPYRGCEHGCVYCYARPTHEYFGLSAGLDFETKIFVKLDAPELLRKELAKESWEPQTISISGVTDCYQPAERQLGLTRKCIEVLAEFRNPLGIVTKSHLVTRDIDILSELARDQCAAVFVSVTTLDPTLSSRLEPRAAAPARRLDTISQLSRAGIPVGVMVAPWIPGLTDHEMPMILKACADAGARTCAYVPLRLPGAVAPIFEDWLERHCPDRKSKVLNRIRALRGGKLNDSNFHSRMRGEGIWAAQFQTMFDLAKQRAGLDKRFEGLSPAKFRRPRQQMGFGWQ